MTFVPLSRPPVDDEIKRAVLAAIDSRQYILGPQCRQLEVELASTTGVKHAVLTSSATAALWLALRALGVKAGDEVLVPSHTAFPTVEAICVAEATPIFVDADEFYTLDTRDAEAKATPRTVGMVPVHLYGQSVDLAAVERLASRLGIWVLEDCAQAQGAEWDGRRVGSFGRAAVFSFYPSKNLPGMGDGGAVLTRDDEIADRCRRLRDHGRLDKNVHAELGFNLRFSELQAAALRVLLPRLDAMNERRRALALRYADGSTWCARRAGPSWRSSSRSAGSRPGSTIRSRRIASLRSNTFRRRRCRARSGSSRKSSPCRCRQTTRTRKSTA